MCPTTGEATISTLAETSFVTVEDLTSKTPCDSLTKDILEMSMFELGIPLNTSGASTVEDSSSKNPCDSLTKDILEMPMFEIGIPQEPAVEDSSKLSVFSCQELTTEMEAVVLEAIDLEPDVKWSFYGFEVSKRNIDALLPNQLLSDTVHIFDHDIFV